MWQRFFQGGKVVHKLCAICGRYFSGDLNGDYRCRDCELLGEVPLRPLAGLDGLSGFEAGLEPPHVDKELRRPVDSPPARRRAAA